MLTRFGDRREHAEGSCNWMSLASVVVDPSLTALSIDGTLLEQFENLLGGTRDDGPFTDNEDRTLHQLWVLE